MSLESKFQTKVLLFLKELRLHGVKIWIFKAIKSNENGIPDIIGCINGKMFTIELKREKGNDLSPEQEIQKDRILYANGMYLALKECVDYKERIRWFLDV